MVINRSFRYRIYPTVEQEHRLVRWDSALRFLWNIALEQYMIGLSRTDRKYPTSFSQSRELTDLRKELDWLSDVPRAACEDVLSSLYQAWQRCYQRDAGKPRWKLKRTGYMSVAERHSSIWRIDGGNVWFPKLGTIRTVMHRSPVGKAKSCTLKRDGDQWFASIMCEIEVADPVKKTEPVLAIDRGITNLLADSDGNLTVNPKHHDKSLKRLANAQRAVSRKQKGSKNQEKAKVRVMRIHRKVRRQREHFLHVLSSTIAKSNGVVVIEKLNVAGMVKNRCLSRSIAAAGWSKFATMLRYKLGWSGGTLVEVPAQYSSQTCSACGAVDSGSRKADKFCCTACGFTDHADLNAAKILKQRYKTPGNPWCLPVDGIALVAPGRSRKTKAKLRTSRLIPIVAPING